MFNLRLSLTEAEMKTINHTLRSALKGIGELLPKLLTLLHPMMVRDADGKAIGQVFSYHLGGVYLPFDPDVSVAEE